MSKKKEVSSQDILQTPKGMRDIIGEDFYKYQGFFEKAQEIVEYYGFSPIYTPTLEHEEIFSRAVGEGTDIVDKEMYTLKTKGGRKLTLRPEGTAGVMRSYIENGMQTKPQPIKVYYQLPFFRHDKPQKGRYREFFQFGIEIIGSPKSVMDALCIHLGYTILKEAGVEDVAVKINSIGDNESRKDYIKELTSYYRKHINKMSAVDRQRLKTNPLRILDSKEKETEEINLEAPQSISYLNSTSKKHFKEVLEYLDELEIPYQMDHKLVRGLDYYSHTVFEFFSIKEDTENNENGEEKEEAVAEKVLALGGGGRYDYLAKAMGSRKEIPGIGFGLGVDRIIEASKKLPDPKIKKKAKFCFIQLGVEAKLKSLKVIETLRENKIQIVHSLSKDSLSSQLGSAEKKGVSYALILGQKEAIENTIIVRDMKNRSQKTIDIDKLSKYIKNLK